MLRSTGRLLSKDPVGFFFYRRAYNQRYKVNCSLCSHPHILKELVKNGICIIENYLDQKTVNKIKSEVSEALSNLRDGKDFFGLETSSYPEYGTYVLHHAQTLSNSSLAFVNDPMIHSMASAFSGGRAVSVDTRAELRSAAKKNLLVDDWHTDTWRFRFKAMLYLTDVTAKNAPFRYLAGSHVDHVWPLRRFWLDYLHHRCHGAAIQEYYLAHQSAKQCQNPSFKKVICTAPAGTLILFDTRGLHCGSVLEKPHRIVLNHCFA